MRSATERGAGGPGGEHGTHVAGIVGARAAAAAAASAPAAGARSATGVRRRLPPETSSFDMPTPIDKSGRTTNATVLDLSLPSPAPDDTVVRSDRARQSRPAPLVGRCRRQLFPAPRAASRLLPRHRCRRSGHSRLRPTHAARLSGPARRSPDAEWFAAAFTDIGPQVDLTGPGVAMVSNRVPGGYGVMSGRRWRARSWGIGSMAARRQPGPSTGAARHRALQSARKAAIETARPLGLGRLTGASACR